MSNHVNIPINDFNGSLVNLLRQIIDVLETSSIAAEERGEDLPFKFWFAYKKISGEYDNNMYERCNGNMDIIMLFAGLFSAVNTAFIIAMQPNPADTTNDLLVQFMQNTWNGSSVTQPVALSAPLAYSSSKIWMQVLAYTSLTFSLLTAFFAVLGKQWLYHYKTNRFDGGRLRDRCQQRHRKFQELENQYFERVLQSFPVLLQISLLLFIVALAAAMWMQHRIVSLFIIVPTACGFIFFISTVVVSLISPDSPFQTWISLAIRYLVRNDQNHADSTADALSWILDTSTNPDVLSLALELMVTVSDKLQHVPSPSLTKKMLDMLTACFGCNRGSSNQSPLLSPLLIKKVLVMFTKCFDSTPLDKGNAVSFGRALIHICSKDATVAEKLNGLLPTWEHWSKWHDLYLPKALERCNTSFSRMKESIVKETVPADLQHQADDMRTDLRMALGAGMDRFFNSDKEYPKLVWEGQFGPDLPDVDWLLDCATQFMGCAKRFNTPQYLEAAGDALLLLSGLKGPLFIDPASIAPFLNSSHESDTLRHSALRAACRAIDVNSRCDPSFSAAILTAIQVQRGHNGDLFANAISLLKVTDWSQYSMSLEGSPLLDIQRLVFLVLSAPSLHRTVEFGQYCRALIHFVDRDTRPESKRVALRVAYRIRRDLAMITGTPNLRVPVPLQNEVFFTLSPALFTIVPPQFDVGDDLYYLRLIFTLASNPNWLPRLDEDCHIKKCIEIIPYFSHQPPPSFFYLAGIFLHACGQPAVRAIETQQWWDMTRMAWHVAGQDNDDLDSDVLDDGIGILEALVTATKLHIPPDASLDNLRFLRNGLGGAISKLESRKSPPSKIISSMKDLKRYEPPKPMP